MKNEIEKLLSDVKAEYSKVIASAMKCRKEELQISVAIGTGQALSFEYVIERLEKILNERNSVDEGEKVCCFCDEGYIQGINGVQKCKSCNKG